MFPIKNAKPRVVSGINKTMVASEIAGGLTRDNYWLEGAPVEKCTRMIPISSDEDKKRRNKKANL